MAPQTRSEKRKIASTDGTQAVDADLEEVAGGGKCAKLEAGTSENIVDDARDGRGRGRGQGQGRGRGRGGRRGHGRGGAGGHGGHGEPAGGLGLGDLASASGDSVHKANTLEGLKDSVSVRGQGFPVELKDTPTEAEDAAPRAVAVNTSAAPTNPPSASTEATDAGQPLGDLAVSIFQFPMTQPMPTFSLFPLRPATNNMSLPAVPTQAALQTEPLPLNSVGQPSDQMLPRDDRDPSPLSPPMVPVQTFPSNITFDFEDEATSDSERPSYKLKALLEDAANYIEADEESPKDVKGKGKEKAAHTEKRKPGPLSTSQKETCNSIAKVFHGIKDYLSDLWGKSPDLIAQRCGMGSTENRAKQLWNLWQVQWYNLNDPIDGEIASAYQGRCAAQYHEATEKLEEGSMEWVEFKGQLLAYYELHMNKEAHDVVMKGGRWKVMKKAELELTEKAAELSGRFQVQSWGFMGSAATGDPNACAATIFWGSDKWILDWWKSKKAGQVLLDDFTRFIQEQEALEREKMSQTSGGSYAEVVVPGVDIMCADCSRYLRIIYGNAFKKGTTPSGYPWTNNPSKCLQAKCVFINWPADVPYPGGGNYVLNSLSQGIIEILWMKLHCDFIGRTPVSDTSFIGQKLLPCVSSSYRNLPLVIDTLGVSVLTAGELLDREMARRNGDNNEAAEGSGTQGQGADVRASSRPSARPCVKAEPLNTAAPVGRVVARGATLNDFEHKDNEDFGTHKVFSNNASDSDDDSVAGASPEVVILYPAADLSKGKGKVPGIPNAPSTLHVPIPGQRGGSGRLASAPSAFPPWITQSSQDSSNRRIVSESTLHVLRGTSRALSGPPPAINFHTRPAVANNQPPMSPHTLTYTVPARPCLTTLTHHSRIKARRPT
ncbi:hypothetical protein BOTBODRAFT_175696 [Botryobasidium botryosum FD-172 SS1]|uniref:Uncharacterized protein n=1 Tax=Botryobasidium botryosum (strain FD-172 SS1) TaxID=930990 RepID=A0A067MFE8_BOTB1|nr:hypothetical protein BOTBODRAFT_175696 [Botryobasidium botryosum FD-172 SS1]